MKLTKNFTVICYLFLLAISNIAAAHVSSSNTRSTTRSRALSKTKMDFSLIKRIFNGIGQAIMGANQALKDKFFTMLGCFKQTSATPKTGVAGTSYAMFDKTIDGIVVGLKWLLAVPRAIFSYICKFKKNVVQYISSLFAVKKLRKYRKMIENGQSLSLAQLKKYRSAWGFMSALKSAGNFISSNIKKVASVAGSSLKFVGGALWNLAKNILYPFVKKHWATIKTAMIAIRDSFFGKNSFIGKLVACAETVSTTVLDEIKTFFNKLKERYQRYKGIYGLGLPYVALYGADMLFTAVCDANLSTDLKATANEVQKAEKEKDQRTETIAGGKLFGSLMKFSTKFTSDFSEKITAAIKMNGTKNGR